jgi:DNA polymerase (family 10)
MENKQVARMFNELASLMELYGENPFRTRTYRNAYMSIRKLDDPILEMHADDVISISGIGKTILSKLEEIREAGSFKMLQEFREKTPKGIRELLNIKGLGPKKIRQLWDELKIESPGELLYACEENRLLELKGFGVKSQNDIRKKMEYHLKTKAFFHLASLYLKGHEIISAIRKLNPESRIEATGAFARNSNILERIELLSDSIDLKLPPELKLQKEAENADKDFQDYHIETSMPLRLYSTDSLSFGTELLRRTGPVEFLDKVGFDAKAVYSDERIFFKSVGKTFVEPQYRDVAYLDGQEFEADGIIQEEDIKGLIHCHTTYSDGIHTLKQMVEHARSLGFEYILITDHSKSAFYANGLSVDRLYAQIQEIDELNAAFDDITILKGIESDILNNGALDYEADVLEELDVVIASIHSNLKMDENKATQRLLTAIEDPHTHMLGHPTGRLLLSREAYPIDHLKVIDACAANGVRIEINANPYRLDLDWRWIPYAQEKGVKICINPDAHSMDQMKYIKYGVLSAQKGLLRKDNCLNALPVDAFLAALAK